MTAEMNPEDQMPDLNSAQQIAQRMDPNVELALQQANQSGDTSIAQFIERQGITTPEQLLQAVENGFIDGDKVPAIQDMIEEKNRKLALQDDGDAIKAKQKEEAEYEDIADRMAQNNEARAAAAERDAAENDGHGKSYSEMDAAEKAAFLEHVSTMSFADWQNMSKDEQIKTATNTEAALRESLQKNDQERESAKADMYSKSYYGDTAEERKKNADQVIKNQQDALAQAMKEVGTSEADMKDKSLEEVTAIHKRAEEIRGEKNKRDFGDRPEMLKHADVDGGNLDGFDIRRDHGAVWMKRIQEAPNDIERQKIYEAYEKTQSSAQGTGIVTHDAEIAAEKVAETHAKVANDNTQDYKNAHTIDDVDVALKHAGRDATIEGAHLAAGNVNAERIVEQARVERMEARKDAVLSERVEAKEESGFGEDTPAPVATASAAPRLTINGQPLADAGLDKLGAPEPPVAANAPEVKRQAPSSSMGGMG